MFSSEEAFPLSSSQKRYRTSLLPVLRKNAKCTNLPIR